MEKLIKDKIEHTDSVLESLNNAGLSWAKEGPHHLSIKTGSPEDKAKMVLVLALNGIYIIDQYKDLETNKTINIVFLEQH